MPATFTALVSARQSHVPSAETSATSVAPDADRSVFSSTSVPTRSRPPGRISRVTVTAPPRTVPAPWIEAAVCAVVFRESTASCATTQSVAGIVAPAASASVPCSTAVPALYVFAPTSVSMPAPFFVKAYTRSAPATALAAICAGVRTRWWMRTSW